MRHRAILLAAVLACAALGVQPSARSAPPGVSIAAARGDAAGGVAGATWQSFGPPVLDRERIAFRAAMTAGAGGVTTANDTGIWSVDGAGVASLVAREGGAAAGTQGTFAMLGEPVANGGATAFIGKLKPGNGVTGKNAAGIWVHRDGVLSLVARQGARAPGGEGATYSKLLSMGVNDDGEVLFVAKVKGQPKSSDIGAWVADAAGRVSLVLAESYSINVRGSVKFISKFEFLPAVPVVGGQTRGSSADGTVAFKVTYTDKTQGIVTFRRELLFEDEFRSGLKPEWSIVRPSASHTTFGAEAIDLRLNSGDLHEESNNAKNVFLMPTPTAGDFSVTLKATSFAPDETLQYPQIDLLAYDGDDDMVRAGYIAFGDGRGFELATEVGGSYDGDVNGHDLGSAPFWLRLVKIADVYVELYSTDGVSFEYAEGPVRYGDGSPAQLGFVGMANGNESVHAILDSFTVETIARSSAADGDPVAAVPGAKFKTFGPPIVNAAGHVAFTGTLAPGAGVTKANDAVVLVDRGGTGFVVVAREGAAAAGTTGVFTSFSAPVVRDDDAVAFVGTLKKGAGITPANVAGVWIDEGGAMRLVARQGSDAPGTAAGTVFKSFTALALPDDRGVFILATLSGQGVTSANDTAIWAESLSGPLSMLVREGDAVPSSQGEKTIATIEFLPVLKGIGGSTRNFDGGDLVFRATFTDGSEGVVQFEQ